VWGHGRDNPDDGDMLVPRFPLPQQQVLGDPPGGGVKVCRSPHKCRVTACTLPNGSITVRAVDPEG
jgi:hypothetical protein